MPVPVDASIARTSYVVFVPGLAAALALTGSTAVAPWLLLLLLTAPTSVLAFPAVAVLWVLGALFGGPLPAAAALVLWTGLWAVIAAVNAALVEDGPRAHARGRATGTSLPGI